MTFSKIDRLVQRSILTLLAEINPDLPSDEQMEELQALTDETALNANLLYLEEHGLIVSGLTRIPSGECIWNISKLRITCHGHDFMLDDGGLTAILGVVTVKLHEDSLRTLISMRITESDLPQPQKTKLLDQLRSLRAETIKHLTLKLVDAGLANWPTALRAIETYAGNHLA